MQINNNIKNYISSIKRLNLHEFSHPCIILPETFYDVTVQICNAVNETQGILICKKYPNDNVLVESIIVLGTGTQFAVYPNKNKLKAVQRLLQIHPELISIDFHSHTHATGKAFYNIFSMGDITSLTNAINHHNDYMHVLFTPTHVLTFGLKRPSFYVAEAIENISEDQILQRHEDLDREFKSYQ